MCTSTALASERLLRTDTKLSFHAFRVERRFSTASLSSWDKTLISLGIENTNLINFLAILTSICLDEYVGSENNRRYFLGLENKVFY